MAKKVREQNKWPIPSDWDEETDGFQLVLFCIPNSRQWRAIVAGQIEDFTYGRNYNRLTGNIKEAQDVARDIFNSMAITCLDELLTALQCLCDQTTILAEKTQDQGQDVDSPGSDGEVQTGPGEQFPTQGAYLDAKCNVANGVFDTIREYFVFLQSNGSGLLAGLLGGVTSGLLLGAELSFPFGWALSKIDSAIVAIAGFILNVNVGFQDVIDAMDDQHDECVLALFNASNAATAKENFIVAIEGGLPVITSADRELLQLVATFEMINQLFEPRSDLIDYASPDPVDCGSFILQIWTFPTDEEGWTFADLSTANASAVGTYDAGLEALSSDQTVIAGGTQRISRAEWTSPTISQPITVGGAIQSDFSAPSDSILTNQIITVIYDDAREFTISPPASAGAGTTILTMTEDGTIETVIVEQRRSNGGSTTGHNFTIEVLEVRIVGV